MLTRMLLRGCCTDAAARMLHAHSTPAAVWRQRTAAPVAAMQTLCRVGRPCAASQLMLQTVAWSAAHGAFPLRAAASAESSATASVSDSNSGSSGNDLEDGRGHGLYTKPALYDRVFSARDYQQQAAYIVEAFRTHCLRDAESFVELGCGPARHAIQLASLGLHGHALDSEPAMLEHARARSQAAGADVQCIVGDMRDFSLPEPVDLALLLWGTSQHLHSSADAAACFRAVSRALVPGGLLFLEMLHPEDLFGGFLEEGDTWEVEDEEGHLQVHYGNSESDQFNAVTQTMERTVEVFEVEGGRKRCLSREQTLQRFFTAQEIGLLGDMTGLEVVAQHGGLELPLKGIEDEESIALVVVLQKQML